MPVVLWFAVGHGLAAVGWAWVIFMPIATIPTFVLAFRSALPPTVPLLAHAALAIGVGAATYPLVLWLVFCTRVTALLAVARTLRAR